MIAAGLLAKKAVEKGLNVPPYVKTSLAPGSRVVTDYFEKAGLDDVPRQARLQHRRLRLHDLHRQQRPAARADRQGGRPKDDLVVAGVLSRQPQLRRPHQSAREGELPRQPAAGRGLRAGRHDRHRPGDRAARHRHGRQAGVPQATSGRRTPKCKPSSTQCVLPEMFADAVRQRLGQEPEVERDQDQRRRAVRVGRRRAPTSRSRRSSSTCRRSRRRSSRSAALACLAALGDSVTTDHISPAGSIAKDSPAGQVPDRARRRAASTSTATAPAAATTA